MTPLQALSAVEAVAPAVELIDSRYQAFKFSLTDVVADNSSSSGFVVGPWHAPDVDFSNLGIVVSFNGSPVLVGSTAAILGHPLRSLVAAARFAAEADEPLQAGLARDGRRCEPRRGAQARDSTSNAKCRTSAAARSALWSEAPCLSQSFT